MKKYLFLAATAAVMFASCSDDINSGDNGFTTPTNGLALKTLSSSSQAGRVSVNATRGVKADRLELVATIKPVSTEAEHHWSATGVAFVGDNAYISWHSNHQAQTPADLWGGAVDQISISALQAGNSDASLISTQYAPTVKFNNVVAEGNNLYFPLTCYNNGAVVARMTPGAEAMDTIGIPGSSANSVYVDGDRVYAATGYAGGVFSMPADFTKDSEFTAVVAYNENFGGKYIADGYVLRSDDSEAALISLNNPATVRSLGAPLKSALKYAEAYDPANNQWHALTGDKAAHYGKHTMAIRGGYIYVGGGIGTEGKNGLRVYAVAGTNEPVWENGTNTTAVAADDKYVYAATGAGLRVYEKYNSTDKDLKLFAYEVESYTDEGKAIGYQAGTQAHSSNFVAVEPQTGLIFVAAGQTGVLVFRLNENAAPKATVPVSLIIDAINSTQTAEVEEGESHTFVIPTEKPSNEGYDFIGWSKTENATTPDYQGGDSIEVSGDTNLYPVWKEHEYKHIVTFVQGATASGNISGMPAVMKTDNDYIIIPANPSSDKTSLEFVGWATDSRTEYTWIEAAGWTPIKAGDRFNLTEKDVTLYGVWVTNAHAGGSQGGQEEQKPEPNPGGTGGAGDVGGETPAK